MNWVDYREKLGVGFADNDKFQMCKNRINNLLVPSLGNYYTEGCLFKYANYVGESFSGLNLSQRDRLHSALISVGKANNLREFISKYVALINSAKDKVITRSDDEAGAKGTLAQIFESAIIGTLNDFRVPYDIIHDEDGVFIFPKGIPEYDKELVTDTYMWLSQYPETEKAWGKALKEYSNGTEPSDIADQLRKALERFFQNFFNSTKSLENLKAEYGKYLKGHGIPGELAGNLETVIQQYTNFMNHCAKHHDKTSKLILEYLVYQTGNIMRLLINLKNSASIIELSP